MCYLAIAVTAQTLEKIRLLAQVESFGQNTSEHKLTPIYGIRFSRDFPTLASDLKTIARLLFLVILIIIAHVNINFVVK